MSKQDSESKKIYSNSYTQVAVTNKWYNWGPSTQDKEYRKYELERDKKDKFSWKQYLAGFK